MNLNTMNHVYGADNNLLYREQNAPLKAEKKHGSERNWTCKSEQAVIESALERAKERNGLFVSVCWAMVNGEPVQTIGAIRYLKDKAVFDFTFYSLGSTEYECSKEFGWQMQRIHQLNSMVRRDEAGFHSRNHVVVNEGQNAANVLRSVIF